MIGELGDVILISLDVTAGELVVLCLTVLLVAVVVFICTKMMQIKKIAQMDSELVQNQETVVKLTAQVNDLLGRLSDSETALHNTAINESRIIEQFKAAEINEHRVREELEESRASLATFSRQLEASRQGSHQYEKEIERTHAEIKALTDQLSELRERLSLSDTTLTEARVQLNNAKELLAEEGKKAKAVEASEKEAREQLAEVKLTLESQIQEYRQLQERFHIQSNEFTELKTTLTRREEHFKDQMLQLKETKQSLNKDFENLANKIFEEKGKTFTHTSQASIDHMLKPFREQIEGFQKRINDVHDASIKGNTGLNAEIKKVLDIGLQMSQEANNLTSALKGDSQQRGAWGEAQLQRTLEMSGLIEDAHYEVQSAFKDSEGKNKQTDYLIKLPDDKQIIIDSKVALNAYDRAVGAKTPEEHQLAMNEHFKAVRKHIDDLASKDYTNLIGMRSPSFVLMFMPVEPAYIEALKSQKDLFEYGYKKGVVLVSHTTLIPILRTVSNLWMMERSNAEAREISERAGDIYNQVCMVAERLSKLGGTLNTASKHYNNTITALAGQQGLYGKIDRFSQLSAKVSKSLPPMEPTHMDFENERLSLIVEPLEEGEPKTTLSLKESQSLNAVVMSSE